MSTPGPSREWIGLLAGGGVIGSILTLVFRSMLAEKREEKRRLRQDERETRDKRIETDRATYQQRITVLVFANLAAYIRAGKWFTDEDDLRRLVASLAQGTYEHFLDPVVDSTWCDLVRLSVELANRRASRGQLDASEIRDYNTVRQRWEDAAKRSFGPLPPTTEIPIPRRTPRGVGEGESAAA